MRLLVMLFLLCSCASTVPDRRAFWVERWPDLVAPEGDDAALELSIFRARRPDRQQSVALDQALLVYVEDGDEAFAPLRDQLAEDPVTAFWLARSLAVFTLQAFARAGAGERGLLIAGEPVWQRPLDQLAAMGGDAVPFVVLDLLENSAGDRRDFGVRVLSSMGPEAFPAWSFLLAEGSLRTRRLAMRVLSAWPPSVASLPVLERALADPDFGVRAGAYRGLARGGESQAGRMREALQSEPDPFVRRAILDSLVNFKDRETAFAVLLFYEHSLEVGEFADLRRADTVLQEISGIKGSRNLAGWRAWIQAEFDRS